MPIVEFYEAQGKVRRIDASKERDEVYADVLKAFEGHLGRKLKRFVRLSSGATMPTIGLGTASH